MQILAIDTTTEACSVALYKDGIVHAYFKKCSCEHARYALYMIKSVLDQSTSVLTDFDALAFGRGPGSFTGVRIGVSITQGLALGAKLPVIGVSTLATIAQSVWYNTGATQVLASINAGMGEVYWAEYVFDEQQNIWYGEKSETILKISEINERLKQLSGKWTIAGTGWRTLLTIIDKCEIFQESNILLPTAENILPIACQLFAAGKALPVEQAEPIYLRNELTWKKFSG